MIRVYVAGRMSDPNPLVFLDNLRHGQAVSYNILKAGFAVFSPFIDYSLWWHGPISMDEIKAHSMAWLERADVLYLMLDDKPMSSGVTAEVARAKELGIPIVTTMGELAQQKERR